MLKAHIRPHYRGSSRKLTLAVCGFRANCVLHRHESFSTAGPLCMHALCCTPCASPCDAAQSEPTAHWNAHEIKILVHCPVSNDKCPVACTTFTTIARTNTRVDLQQKPTKQSIKARNGTKPCKWLAYPSGCPLPAHKTPHTTRMSTRGAGERHTATIDEPQRRKRPDLSNLQLTSRPLRSPHSRPQQRSHLHPLQRPRRLLQTRRNPAKGELE